MLFYKPHQLIVWLLIVILGSSLAGCSDDRPVAERLTDNMEAALADLQTVAGRLEISSGPVTLQQELWVQRPGFLRTETEEGPAAYAGTIVVLNDQEGWFYNPALNMVTVTDRSNYDPTVAAEAGAGSMLERMPTDILTLLRAAPAINEIGVEQVAGRATNHLEIVIAGQTQAFPTGLLQLWLDQQYGYPLKVINSNGLEIRFTTVKFNTEIDPLTFVFVPPPGALVRRVEP